MKATFVAVLAAAVVALTVQPGAASADAGVDSFVQQAELTASDGAALDHLGAYTRTTLAVSGSTIVAGSANHQVGSNSRQGAVYVFSYAAGAWTQTAELTASDGGASDQFGASVAISGTTIVVGAPDHAVGANSQQGAAYVFTNTSGTWTQTAELTASNGGAAEQFGTAVAISGSTIVAGAPEVNYPNLGTGEVYAFTNTSGSWPQTADLTPSDGGSAGGFGTFLGISGSTIVAAGTTQPDKIHVFGLGSGGWQQTAEPTEPQVTSLAVSGDTIVAGASQQNDSRGAAYVFSDASGTWQPSTTLTATPAVTQADPGDFGISVATSGATIVVGAPINQVGANTIQGTAFVFTDSGGSWQQTGTLTATDGAHGDWLGSAAAISGGAIVAGAYNHTVGSNSDQGALYVYGAPSGEGTVAGSIATRVGDPVAGAKVRLTGQDDFGTSVSQTLLTDAAGRYSTRVTPGTYAVEAIDDPPDQRGGSWAAVRCSGSVPLPGARCALSHLADGGQVGSDFTYTPCGAANDLPPGTQPTGCPIIFIPGILGSVIQCNGSWLWPRLPRAKFADMQLRPDGQTNAGAPGSCNATATTQPGFDGVVQSVAGVDAYGKALDFIHNLEPGRAYAYPYDWRMGADRAVNGLDQTIKQALRDSSAQKVVLWAHSMGGLVARSYIDDATRAKNVARLVSVGTPYLGAPKSMFSLLEGDTDTPEGGVMDLLVNAGDLQEAARNYEGLFWLYPSDAFGSWLEVGGHELNDAGVERFVASLGGTPALLERALAGHRAIDGFKTNGVEYQAVVGTGVPTVQRVSFAEGVNGVISFGIADIGNGDGTVPLKSEAQNAPEGATHNGDVPLHYVCGIGHGDETGDAGVEARIKGFLLTGADVSGEENDCPVSGAIYRAYDPYAVVHSASTAAAKPGAALTPTQAKRAGLADVTTLGQTTMIVTDAHHPVSIALPLHGAALTVQTFSGSRMSKAHGYRPAAGTVTLDQTGRVARKGKTLKPGRADTKAPRTVAHVRHHGKRVVVTLVAHDTGGSGVAVTWVQIGKAKAKRYRRPLKLSAKQLKSLRFSSIDHAGNLEPSRRAR